MHPSHPRPRPGSCTPPRPLAQRLSTPPDPQPGSCTSPHIPGPPAVHPPDPHPDVCVQNGRRGCTPHGVHPTPQLPGVSLIQRLSMGKAVDTMAEFLAQPQNSNAIALPPPPPQPGRRRRGHILAAGCPTSRTDETSSLLGFRAIRLALTTLQHLHGLLKPHASRIAVLPHPAASACQAASC